MATTAPRSESDEASDAGVTFLALPGLSRIEILDPIERHRYTLSTPVPVDPGAEDPASFRFPVDEAINLTTSSLTLPSVVALYVRTADGDLLSEIEQFADYSVDPGSYIIEICAPIKLYIEVDAALSITSDLESMRIQFAEATDIALGARSAHDRPAGTITTTTDPADVMAAVTRFSSALKSTSPERSFPTLRGHPPALEIGDRLAIPEEISPADTGITIELRPDLAEIYPAASLSYYLGATLKPGTDPLIRTDSGFVHRLDSHRGVPGEIGRVLKQVFLLDCVIRTDGLYPVDLQERRRIEGRIDRDFDGLYRASLADRLESYLELPYTKFEDLVPSWGLTAHMPPTPAGLEILPYLVDDLALIQIHDPDSITDATTTDSLLDGFDGTGEFTRSTAGGAATDVAQPIVRPPETDAVEQVWCGKGTPIGASKAVPAAFENRLDRTPVTGDIDITVVCNSSSMNAEEGLVNEIYASRDDLPFNLDLRRDLTREELGEVLQAESDFLHYIGHIDDQGVECRDGKLDIAELETVGVDSFLLNACQSYQQGRRLIEAGSIGGIVTLNDVINGGAIRIGRLLAQLLNTGFPLYAALDIAKHESLMGARYIVVGDGRMALTQPRSVPYLCEVDTANIADSFDFTSFPTNRVDIGSMTLQLIGNNDRHTLVSRTVSSMDPTEEDLLEFLHLENMPVRIDTNLRWSQEVRDL